MSSGARRAGWCMVLIALIALIALLGGCAIPPSGVVRTVPWTVGDTTLTLSPPGALGDVALSSLDAREHCIAAEASCASRAPTAIELALAVDPGTNLIASEGTVVWAIEWLDVECPPRAGPFIDGSQPPAPPPGRCDEITVIDANAGTNLFTLTAPHDATRR